MKAFATKGGVVWADLWHNRSGLVKWRLKILQRLEVEMLLLLERSYIVCGKDASFLFSSQEKRLLDE